MAGEWIGRGKVRARESAGGVEITIDEITTQARVYKPLVYEFFRKEFAHAPALGRVRGGDLVMEHAGEAPGLDLDNLAKALLDALKGHVFFDDSQIARLLCERRAGERDRILVRTVKARITHSRGFTSSGTRPGSPPNCRWPPSARSCGG